VYLARSKDIAVAKGEAVSPSCEKFLHDALTIPDLAAVEASFNRSTLASEWGGRRGDGLDVAQSIQATNSLEKMLAHQLAAIHKLAMVQMGQVSYDRNGVAETKRLSRDPMHGRAPAGSADFTQDAAERSANHRAVCQCQQRQSGRHRKCSTRQWRRLGNSAWPES